VVTLAIRASRVILVSLPLLAGRERVVSLVSVGIQGSQVTQGLAGFQATVDLVDRVATPDSVARRGIRVTPALLDTQAFPVIADFRD
jgi:hypothetical protein